jgi:hypothetical protein
MFSADDSLECVMAAMMHSDMLNEYDDDDRSVDSEGGKRRRSSALSSLASKTSDCTPRGSLTDSDAALPFSKESVLQDGELLVGSEPSKFGTLPTSNATASFSFGSLGASFTKNLADMQGISQFSMELPIFDGISGTNFSKDTADDSSHLGQFSSFIKGCR